MQILKLAALPLAALAITACESEAEKQADVAEDRMETQAEQSAAAAGMEEAALGMTELQLIDADLVAADGTDLGDIEAVHRDASGAVDGLFVELDNTDPDRRAEHADGWRRQGCADRNDRAGPRRPA